MKVGSRSLIPIRQILSSRAKRGICSFRRKMQIPRFARDDNS